MILQRAISTGGVILSMTTYPLPFFTTASVSGVSPAFGRLDEIPRDTRFASHLAPQPRPPLTQLVFRIVFFSAVSTMNRPKTVSAMEVQQQGLESKYKFKIQRPPSFFLRWKRTLVRRVHNFDTKLSVLPVDGHVFVGEGEGGDTPPLICRMTFYRVRVMKICIMHCCTYNYRNFEK